MDTVSKNTPLKIQNSSLDSRNVTLDEKNTTELSNILDMLQTINSVMLPVLLLVGVVGNILTIIVLNTPAYWFIKSRFFLMALAISDITLLLTQPLNKDFVARLFRTDIRALSNLGCKIFFVFFKTAKMSSSWFIVCISFERFVAVWFPFKAKTICSRRLIWILITTIYFSLFVFTSFWSYSSIIQDETCHPDIYNISSQFESNLFGTLLITALSFYSIIPMILLLITTPLIILKLSRHQKTRKKLAGTNGKLVDNNRINIMLIGLMIAYAFLVTPITALHMQSYILKVRAFGNTEVGFLIFKETAQLLEQINYAINFYLYAATSPIFRASLRSILTFRKRRSSQKKESSSTKITSIYSSQLTLAATTRIQKLRLMNF